MCVDQLIVLNYRHVREIYLKKYGFIYNLYIRLSFHFTCDTDEEIRDFEMYLSIISKDVILMLLYYTSYYIYIYITIPKKEKNNYKFTT